jgi:branched-chain amino acid transport system substrate-binding protein
MIGAFACLSLLLVLAGCGSSSSSSGSSSGGGSGGGSSSSGETSSEPIKVGNISTLTNIPLPWGEEGAKAYFDALNERGGIDGRKIEYIVADDKLNPTTASGLARKMVQQEGVVAFAGGISLIDCTVNGKFYEQEGVANIMAGGSDPSCYSNEMISPVNSGVLTNVTAGLLFLEEEGITPACSMANNIPTLNDAYPEAVKEYEEISGNSVPYETSAASTNANFTTLMLQVKNAGCKGLVSTVSGPEVLAVAKAAKQVGWEGTIVFGGAAYEKETPKVLGSLGEGTYLIGEFYPFTSKSKVLDPVLKDLEAAGYENTNLTTAGWLSAKILADTMEGIEGEITRESVREALQELTSFDTEGLTAEPYAFGPGKEHLSNRSIYPVKIENEEFNSSETSFVTIPKK